MEQEGNKRVRCERDKGEQCEGRFGSGLCNRMSDKNLSRTVSGFRLKVLL
jgi:hypothetical protein